MITLYTLNQSRSTRIAWLLEELGLDYQVEAFERDPNTWLAPDALKQIHPLGKAPVLRDGDLLLAESGAIVEYVIERHGNGALRPTPSSPQYPDYLYWLHAAEGSLMPLLVMTLIFRKVENQPQPFFVKPITRKISQSVGESYIRPNLSRQLDYVERSLQDKIWLLGDDLSGADIMMSFPLQAAQARFAEADYPNIRAYVERIQQRAAWQQAEQRVGKLDLG